MAKVILGQERDLYSDYHVYKQPSGLAEPLIIRRKVAMPSDVQHANSFKTQLQRRRLTIAAKRWAAQPSFIKADLTNEYGLVYQRHSPTISELTALQGRELFVSEDIHEQEYHGTHKTVPLWACIVLVNQLKEPIEGDLTLSYIIEDTATLAAKIQLCLANFLFVTLPRGAETYIPYGFAPGYYDPGGMYLSEDQLSRHHYHVMMQGTPPEPPEPPPGSNTTYLPFGHYLTSIGGIRNTSMPGYIYTARAYRSTRNQYIHIMTCWPRTWQDIQLPWGFFLFSHYQNNNPPYYPPWNLTMPEYQHLDGCFYSDIRYPPLYPTWEPRQPTIWYIPPIYVTTDQTFEYIEYKPWHGPPI